MSPSLSHVKPLCWTISPNTPHTLLLLCSHVRSILQPLVTVKSLSIHLRSSNGLLLITDDSSCRGSMLLARLAGVSCLTDFMKRGSDEMLHVIPIVCRVKCWLWLWKQFQVDFRAQMINNVGVNVSSTQSLHNYGGKESRWPSRGVFLHTTREERENITQKSKSVQKIV